MNLSRHTVTHTDKHTHILHKEQTWSAIIFITSSGTSGNRECSSVRSCIWQEACAGSIIFAMLWCNSYSLHIHATWHNTYQQRSPNV